MARTTTSAPGRLNPDGLDHAGFTEPVHAFVPSVAISNLIQVGAKQFPRWAGDFLIGSLREETLYRVRIREGRVIFVEPLTVGKRIRDLVEAKDGRVLLWSDDETVTVLSRRPDANTGEEIFDQCRVCHERMGRDRGAGAKPLRHCGAQDSCPSAISTTRRH